MVQVGIAYDIQNTFANPVYCSMEAWTRPQTEKTLSAWGIETLGKRYPEGIFVVAQAQTALSALVDLIEVEEIRPALIIATPAGFVNVDANKERLQESLVPYITIDSRKGNAVVAAAIVAAAIVAAAIVDGLVDLAWQAYGQDRNGGS
jgi:precorrin-8X/cobalt-precorrin-8 methylmutase